MLGRGGLNLIQAGCPEQRDSTRCFFSHRSLLDRDIRIWVYKCCFPSGSEGISIPLALVVANCWMTKCFICGEIREGCGLRQIDSGTVAEDERHPLLPAQIQHGGLSTKQLFAVFSAGGGEREKRLSYGRPTLARAHCAAAWCAQAI